MKLFLIDLCIKLSFGTLNLNRQLFVMITIVNLQTSKSVVYEFSNKNNAGFNLIHVPDHLVAFICYVSQRKRVCLIQK